MATSYTTPGVYVEEISTLPASIAPVATAVPAFIGYTKQRIKNGVSFGINTPVRIKSLLEYEEIFGTTLNEAFTVKLEDPSSGSTLPTITVQSPTTWSPYNMYYQVQMYFGNGGGPCWIVSVGDIGTASSLIDKDELKDGLNACEKEDEITLLVIPELVKISTAASRKELNDAMMAQCAKLQDRFTVMDMLEEAATSVKDTGDHFRSNDVGSNNLKYGATYFPSLKTTINYLYDLGAVVIDDVRTADQPYDTLNIDDLNGGLTAANATGTIEVTANPSAGEKITIAGVTFTFAADSTGNNIEIGATPNDTAANIRAEIIGHAKLSAILTPTVATDTVTLTAKGIMAGSAGNAIEISTTSATITVTSPLSGGADASDLATYNAIIAKLEEKTVTLYPSATMCGVYASVDRTRGVWKAPANYSVNMVSAPNIDVTAEEQGLLNVDATSGKSINVIRTFTGKGVLVWGARTLAGNDNEWRYVPVRRLYIFIEESVKKATEFVVFEPNDANTWQKVKTMIENFLNTLWRDGALAGAKPEDAFFVKVGLGVTMTSLDILEGRMNIEIGMAAVRPAEFIILKFSHLLAKS